MTIEEILIRDVTKVHSVLSTATDARSNSVIFFGHEPLSQFLSLKKKGAVEGFKLVRGTSHKTDEHEMFQLSNGKVVIVCAFDKNKNTFSITVNL